MAVLLKCGAIFLHIPKTGGSWVTQTLRAQGLVRREFGHIHADMVRAGHSVSGIAALARHGGDWLKSQVPKQLKALRPLQATKLGWERWRDDRRPFTFCMVRHPLRWYESWWQYLCEKSGSDWSERSDFQIWHPCRALRDLGSPNFETFVGKVNRQHPGFVTELFGLYTQEGIGFVGKQERLTDDLVSVLHHLNVPFDEDRIRNAPHANTSRSNVGELVWSPSLLDLTQRLEFAGLVRYGYQDLA